MTVYAVFKEGIYRHECAGVFYHLETAKAVADRALSRGDGHHSFEVVPFELDAGPVFTIANLGDADEWDRWHHGDDVAEAKAVYIARKEKTR